MPVFTAPDGTSLVFDDPGGEGPPILALAGLTRTAADFDFVAPHLPPCRLIRMDYRGRGRSAWADPATYTIQTEATDALALIDHLGLPKTAVLGTSRGGLIAFVLALVAKDRLTGVALNDIGPEIDPVGLAHIQTYIGRRPEERTLAEAARARARSVSGFENVSEGRWAEEVSRLYVETAEGLDLQYDPRLSEIFSSGATQPAPDLWPMFDALEGLPTALIRGANSNLLGAETAAEMRRRRPDMIYADVPDRGHVPFLDEPEALAALTSWIDAL
ncbi:MAG: alpha/beta hydrolase [Pseudomonadota bacterium]